MILLPEELLVDVGQSSANLVLQKYPTEIIINNAYDEYVKETERIAKNSCVICGEPKDTCYHKSYN
jgi:hypothetical protein